MIKNKQKIAGNLPPLKMADGTPLNMPPESFIYNTKPPITSKLNLQQVQPPDNNTKPPITSNPMDLYDKAGINVIQQNGSFIPQSLQDLTGGIEKGFNFGIPLLKQIPTTKQNLALQNNIQDLTNMQTPTPKSFLQNLAGKTQNTLDDKAFTGVEKIGSFLNSPVGRGLLVAGIVGATGGGGLAALGYGAATGSKNYNLRQEDKKYRNLAGQAGYDFSQIKGYMTEKDYKNLIEMENSKFTKEYKNALLQQKVSDSKRKFSILEKDYLRKQGLTNAQIDNLESKTYYTNTKTEYIPKEFELKEQRQKDLKAINEARLEIQRSNNAILQAKLDLMNKKTMAAISNIDFDNQMDELEFAERQNNNKLKNINYQYQTLGLLQGTEKEEFKKEYNSVLNPGLTTEQITAELERRGLKKTK